jgi:hypothetical protein
MDKLDYMKLKIFCTKKGMVSKLKTPPTEWHKIFARYTSAILLLNNNLHFLFSVH